MWPTREKSHAWTKAEGVVPQLSISPHHLAHLIPNSFCKHIESINIEYMSLGNCPALRAIQEDE